MTERATDDRRQVRTAGSLLARYGAPGAEARAEGLGLNVSRSGIFVGTRSPLPVGSLLRVECESADGRDRIRGRTRVVWVRLQAHSPQEPAGMGLEFLELDAGSAAAVERLLRRGDLGSPGRPGRRSVAQRPPRQATPQSLRDDDEGSGVRPVSVRPTQGVGQGQEPEQRPANVVHAEMSEAGPQLQGQRGVEARGARSQDSAAPRRLERSTDRGVGEPRMADDFDPAGSETTADPVPAPESGRAEANAAFVQAPDVPSVPVAQASPPPGPTAASDAGSRFAEEGQARFDDPVWRAQRLFELVRTEAERQASAGKPAEAPAVIDTTIDATIDAEVSMASGLRPRLGRKLRVSLALMGALVVAAVALFAVIGQRSGGRGTRIDDAVPSADSPGEQPARARATAKPEVVAADRSAPAEAAGAEASRAESEPASTAEPAQVSAATTTAEATPTPAVATAPKATAAQSPAKPATDAPPKKTPAAVAGGPAAETPPRPGPTPPPPALQNPAPTAAPKSAPSPLDQARSCLADGDHECVVTALRGKAHTRVERELLITTYQLLGRTQDAQAQMRAYLERYPNGPSASSYRRELGIDTPKPQPPPAATTPDGD
ncbi:MAG: PilZ domain-containing protein [Myxococcales bacterium]|nr:PilZ domain-containing protein [Myxococcales bacterium]